MEEKQKEKEYQFINEIIIPKKKNKWLVRLETLLVVIFMAAVFGFVARWVFLSSDGYLKEWLGIQEQQNVELPTLLPPINSTTNSENSLSNKQNNSIEMYEEIHQLSKDTSSSIVIVEVVEQGIDWFQETYETLTWTTGLILSENETDLLILANAEKISKESSIKVYFGEIEIEGQVYSMDKDYGLAVIAVSLLEISREVFQKISFVRFAEEDIEVGTPVIALGGPNGYKNSLEVGMITSLGDTISVIDGELSYFTTNMIDYPDSNGFVFNLSGEVMGMITHTHKKNINDEVSSVISLKNIRNVIISLLNGSKQVMFGIQGEDIPNSYRIVKATLKKEKKVGVYVTGVEAASPAFDAGIKAGDIIVAINGKQIEGIQEWKELLLERNVGEIVQITFDKYLEYGWIVSQKVQVRLAEKK